MNRGRQFGMKAILFLIPLAGIVVVWMEQDEYRRIGAFESSSGVQVAVFDERGFCDLRRMLKYELTDNRGQTRSRSDLSFVDCDQGYRKKHFRLVEIDEGNTLGLFLVVDYEGFDARSLLLLVYRVGEGESYVGGEGAPQDTITLLLDAYNEVLQRES